MTVQHSRIVDRTGAIPGMETYGVRCVCGWAALGLIWGKGAAEDAWRLHAEAAGWSPSAEPEPQPGPPWWILSDTALRSALSRVEQRHITAAEAIAILREQTETWRP